MLTDLLQSIYNRIAQLGKSIQDLKGSLDSLNANIEDKITKLTNKISEFSSEIGVTQTKHIETLKDIGEGVTKPLRLYMKMDGKEDQGCWKNPKGKQQGHLEGWQYEIAAYRMDKLMELKMIPPTVERDYDGKPGSLQYWVVKKYSLLDIMEEKIGMPRSKVDNFDKMKFITRAFDSLIGNEDRTQQNILLTADWRVLLIDHSRSFRSSRKFTRRLMYGKNGIKSQKLFERLPRDFVEKIKALNFEDIKNAVGPYLNEKEIEAILKRRDLIIKEIDEMIAEKGEGNVLY